METITEKVAKANQIKSEIDDKAQNVGEDALSNQLAMKSHLAPPQPAVLKLNKSVLNDPKATVIAAVIGAIGLIVGAVIGFGGTYLTLQGQITVEREKQNIQDKSKQNEQIRKSFDEALGAMQRMKDSISDVANSKSTYGNAAKELENASTALIYAYGGNPETGSRANYIDICGAASKECSFHKAKETGRQATQFVQAQPENDQLSDEAIKRLNRYHVELDGFQQEISKSKSIFFGERVK